MSKKLSMKVLSHEHPFASHLLCPKSIHFRSPSQFDPDRRTVLSSWH